MVLGDHPCAYLAAALLRDKKPLGVVHVPLPHDRSPDRVVYVNPAVFKLHRLAEAARAAVPLTPVHGLEFHGDNPEDRSHHRATAPIGYCARLADVRGALRAVAVDHGVRLLDADHVRIAGVDDRGVVIEIGDETFAPAALIVAGNPTDAQRRVLGLPHGWGRDVLSTYAYAELPTDRLTTPDAGRTLHMSLDLGGTLAWAWMVAVGGVVHLAVQQPASAKGRPAPGDALGRWAQVLVRHKLLATADVPPGAVRTVDMPVAGALAQDGVATRTLMIGPGGGFYSACCEDVYPCCWSAVHAAEVLVKALKEPHLQDALGQYRAKWRTTLGIYLQGPQQNLRFLLPLVYRNQVMATRMAEAILTGKAVVR